MTTKRAVAHLGFLVYEVRKQWGHAPADFLMHRLGPHFEAKDAIGSPYTVEMAERGAANEERKRQAAA